jgi:Spy/CpxP family protein refolding chaperone
MKFNAFKVILVGGILGGALLLLPNLSNAQNASRSSVLEQLDLTTDQETQLTQIRQHARTQLETLLSSDQQEAFKTKMLEGATFQDAIAAMNLSENQRVQVRTIFQSTKQEAATVLTPEQRQIARGVVQARLGDRTTQHHQ